MSTRKPPTKKPKLGRYDALAAEYRARYDASRRFFTVPSEVPTSLRPSVVDLFAGAGGISCGLESAGFQVVSAVEIVDIAAATHRRNFPECEVFTQDIADYDSIAATKGQRVHLVVGGPPCQGFSVAGKRDPKDPRNKLFYEFVRVVKELQPDYFVMENVPGILTMSGGKVKDAILEAFAEIGYPNVSIAILEAASFGVAQIRSRAIFIGNRHGLVNPYPAPMLSPQEYNSIESAISDLPSWTRIPEIHHEWTKHSKAFTERISKVGYGESLYESFYDAYKRQYPGLPSMTIKENHGGTHIHPHLDRCISAREMARLQSFPDHFMFEGSMKKAMWQIGNAVPPRLAEVIGRTLLPFIQNLYGGPAPQLEEWVPPEASSNQELLFG